MQFAVCLYRDLMEAGRDLGVSNAGRSAVDCLRIERVIPQMGSEMTTFITPWEAGIKERVQLNKVQCKFKQSVPFAKLIAYLIYRRFWRRRDNPDELDQRLK